GGGGGAGHADLDAGVSLPGAGGGRGVPPAARVLTQPAAVRLRHAGEPDAVHLPRRRAAVARVPQRLALPVAASPAPGAGETPVWPAAVMCSPSRAVARVGVIDRTAQCNLCNLLRSDTPKQIRSMCPTRRTLRNEPTSVSRTNGTYFSVRRFAILRLIL